MDIEGINKRLQASKEKKATPPPQKVAFVDKVAENAEKQAKTAGKTQATPTKKTQAAPTKKASAQGAKSNTNKTPRKGTREDKDDDDEDFQTGPPEESEEESEEESGEEEELSGGELEETTPSGATVMQQLEAMKGKISFKKMGTWAERTYRTPQEDGSWNLKKSRDGTCLVYEGDLTESRSKKKIMELEGKELVLVPRTATELGWRCRRTGTT